MDGMFGFVKRSFDVEVRRADGEADAWNAMSFFQSV